MQKNIKKSVMNEIKAIAFSDLTRFVSAETDGEGVQTVKITDTAALPRSCKRALCSVKAGTRGIEVKLYDKLKALELLGRSCGAFSDKAGGEMSAVEQLRSLFEESEEFETD